jgi:hypothetical protein
VFILACTISVVTIQVCKFYAPNPFKLKQQGKGKGKGKVKVRLRTRHEGPEGE